MHCALLPYLGPIDRTSNYDWSLSANEYTINYVHAPASENSILVSVAGQVASPLTSVYNKSSCINLFELLRML